ncbi:aminotransferase class I/II-fold pyridoxal phosphate-dependent enzyme [Sporolactobacillus sp. KGMB 08714]|uniref:aminotransferase class I/II-fold pyridoxal phosphate-dependent enzyme n=1 Tax=Sporolactobacillus sp. KGMB 08714 TaxID=3064704 RepID=UPI002FBF058E
MDQNRTPVFDGLLKYRKKQAYSFHVPGHKDGLIFPEKAASFYKRLLALDATEVADLDDLYHPTGILREGEALLSDYYGTRSSYFLVNGSTGGNMAMVMAACSPGDVVFVQRDCHKSIFNALKLADVRPVFLAPSVDPGSGLAAGIDPEAWKTAVDRFPQAKALILTYPNYYGMAADIGALVREAHDHGLSVLVDEAHGPHFRMGPPVPPSTLEMGADIVVHSAHKMLPAMTMGAFLHVNSPRVPAEKVEKARAMLQTSSPSYAIMASLDLARYYLANLSQSRREHIFSERDAFVAALKTIDKVKVLEAGAGRFRFDPFKITVETETGESGFGWQKRLIAAGIFPELADPRHVLFVLGLTDRIDYGPALKRIAGSLGGLEKKPPACRVPPFPFPRCSTPALAWRTRSEMGTEEADLTDAAGRIAAEPVIPYPPGIPAVIEGERITEQQIAAINGWRRSGAVFQNDSTNHGKIIIYRTGAR